MFFIAKAAFFAAAAWAWMLYQIDRGPTVTGWELFALGAGTCFSLVAVLLGIRFASQRAAARRHEDLHQLLVELSWEALAAGVHEPETAGRVLHLQPGPDRTRR